jgi:hypothetical protein
LNLTLWKRFLYLWIAVIGWVVFILTQAIQVTFMFWLGAVLGIAFALAAIFTSAAYIARGPKDTVIHGIAWTLAVSLGFLAGIFILAEMGGV